ncbi:MAG TPA: hypothetical protein VIX62_10445 [Actinomycetota bacterium]
MTEQRSFKLLVRTRMEKTGESYTAARAALLGGATDPATDGGKAPLAVSDESIRERTGRGWEEWFDALDEWGAQDRPRRDIARWVAEQLTIEPLGWNAQAVTMSYERARRGRAVGEHPDGFRAGVTKTVAVPVDRLFDAFVDSSLRKRWLPDGQLRDRTATKPKAAHFDWADGPSRVHVTFVAKEADKSTATVSHERLTDAAERDRMKAYWKHAMDALELELER